MYSRDRSSPTSVGMEPVSILSSNYDVEWIEKKHITRMTQEHGSQKRNSPNSKRLNSGILPTSVGIVPINWLSSFKRRVKSLKHNQTIVTNEKEKIMITLLNNNIMMKTPYQAQVVPIS